MSLYSCIFKVKQIVTGPPPPDGGGGVDPGGGCTDPNGCGPPPPDDECDGFCPISYCTYDNSEDCDVGTGVVIEETTFTKEDFVTLGIISDCSQSCDAFTPFELNGTIVYPAADAGALDCCIDVPYVYCADNTLNTTCPGVCNGGFQESVNALSPDDAPNEVTSPGGIRGWKTQQQCLENTFYCCVEDKPNTCQYRYCDNGEVRTISLPEGTVGGGGGSDGCGTVASEPFTYGGLELYISDIPWCKRCSRWICVEETGNCEKVTYISSAPGEDAICETGYPDPASCEGDKDNACCDEYEGNGTKGPGAPGSNALIENALSEAYGYLNDYFTNNDPTTFVKCPNDNIISFGAKYLDPIFLGAGTSPYDKEVTGDVPGFINPATGALILDFDLLSQGTAAKTVNITFTRQCGDQATGTVSLLFDPQDFRECSDYQDCLDSIGVDCGFTGPVDPEPIESIQLIQVQNIFDQTSTPVDVVQFDTFIGELLIPQSTFINGPNWWQVCVENGPLQFDSLIDIAAFDAGGNPTAIDPATINWSFTDTLLNFDITNISQVAADSSRYRLSISNLSPGAFSNQAFALYNGAITVGNSVSSKTFNCRSFSENGVSLPGGSVFPRGIDCGSDPGGGNGLPGLGFGSGLNSDIINLAASRNSTNRKKGFPLNDTLVTTKSSSIQSYLTHLDNKKKSEFLSDPVLSNTIYGTRRRVPFLPVVNRGYGKIFNTIVDFRIQLIREFYDAGNDDVDYSESIFSDLTLDNIQRSLTRENRNLVNSLIDVDGSSLRNRILTKIRELIILDKIEDFDISVLNDIQTLSTNTPKSRSTTYNYNAFRDVIDTAEASRSIDPREYSGVNKERVRRWKTIAEDLDKKLLVVELNNDVEELAVSNSDEVNVILADGTPTAAPITDFDTINFVHSDGSLEELVLDTQIHRTKVFDFEETVSLFRKLNEKFNIKMTVNTAANAKIEETASLETPRADKYILKINPETITDIDITNQLIRKTSCEYTLLDESDVEGWVKNKVYPFYKFYVHHSDLFFDHLEKKKTISMEYKDISLYNFSDNDTQDLPVIPRRIPWYVVIIPTDRDDYLTTVGLSKLIDYQTRVIYFNLTPNTSDYKSNFESPVLDEEYGDYYIDTQTNEEFFEDFTYRYNSEKVKTQVQPYKTGEEVLPRREPATMALFKTIREIVEQGDEFIKRNSNTITWGSIYKRLPKDKKKSLPLVEVSNFTDLKSKLVSGRVSSNNDFNKTLGLVKDATNQNIDNASEYTTSTPRKLTTEDFQEETPEILEP